MEAAEIFLPRPEHWVLSQTAEVLDLNSSQAEVSIVSELPMKSWGSDLTTRP